MIKISKALNFIKETFKSTNSESVSARVRRTHSEVHSEFTDQISGVKLIICINNGMMAVTNKVQSS